MNRPQGIAAWHAAGRGEAIDWDILLGSYRSSVDWPSAQSAAIPDMCSDVIVRRAFDGQMDDPAWIKAAFDRHIA
jgi:hypothetical protein